MSKVCHTDPMYVFTLGKARIWAGSKSAVTTYDHWTLMVSALGQVSMTNPISANEGAKALIPPELLQWSAPPMLGIDWPDGGIPRLQAAWWQALVEHIATVEGDVVVFCHGGHGRTGTALSIIACLGGVAPQGKGKKSCPVTWLRKLYCDEAVETLEQCKYIERITGRQVKTVGSHSYSTTSYSPYKPSTAVAAASVYDGGGQSDLPFGVATKQEEAQFENLIGGNDISTKSGEEPVKETLYRWNDEYGNYWTDEVGNIVAVTPEDDDLDAAPQSSEADDLEASEMP